ncbi:MULTISPECIES: hypothetical protein [unclassified Diaminobutyricimonas]|uniref:hypothetical protein n=1 Tax=unclassified Diaminobutyricimonas TaxID=2643261 RepID=UPI0012F48026|nr:MULTISPECIES: hypothetical protein [unclassified Diaminobutyricimonas]
MNILAAIVSIIIFVGGLFLFGYAAEFPGYEIYVFAAGIVAVCVAVAIPIHVLKRIDG